MASVQEREQVQSTVMAPVQALKERKERGQLTPMTMLVRKVQLIVMQKAPHLTDMGVSHPWHEKDLDHDLQLVVS